MRFTNRYGTPEDFVKAMHNDKYDRAGSWRTVTELIDPPRIPLLKTEHWDDIEEDARDRFYAFMGHLGHALLELVCDPTDIKEVRYFSEIMGKKVSGKIDRYIPTTQHLKDYKFTKTWKYIYGDFQDWTKQLNNYAVLMRRNGLPVSSASVVAFFHNWDESKAGDGDYPLTFGVEIPIVLYSEKDAEDYLVASVNDHINAEAGLIRDCSIEERWVSETKWAVMKKGGKRALRVLDSESEAQEYMQANKGDLIVKRPGESKRCAKYCKVSQWCPQHQRSLDEPIV